MDYVTLRYPRVKIIRYENNLGFALAYNRAVALVSEEIVLFLNNDVEVDRDWLAQLKTGLMTWPERTTICGSMLLLYDRRSIINHAGGLLTITGAGIDLDFMKKEGERKGRPHFVGCVSGASMLVPRELFLDLGGFDRDFFAYFEDVDFCWRAWLAGYKVLLVPSSRVYHKISSTMGPRLTPERVFLGEKNRLQAMFKNLELWRALVGLLVSAGYTTSRLALSLSDGRPSVALAILRGNLWFLTHLSKSVAKRMQVQRTRRINDFFLLEHGMMASLLDGIREFSRLDRLPNI